MPHAGEAPRSIEVRRATPADVPRVADALAEAFSRDPPMVWFTPSEEGRVGRLRPYFRALLRRLHIPHGEVWMSDDPVGVAGWVEPGKFPFTTWERRGVIPTEIRTFGRHPIRAARGAAAIESDHPTKPHWYLEYIGVEWSGQGSGAGSALLEPMLDRCDAERVPAFLNAGSPRSRELYRRHGFEVTGRFRLPYDGPPLWRMWRDPR